VSRVTIRKPEIFSLSSTNLMYSKNSASDTYIWCLEKPRLVCLFVLCHLTCPLFFTLCSLLYLHMNLIRDFKHTACPNINLDELLNDNKNI
jgi:hypothetical protein